MTRICPTCKSTFDASAPERCPADGAQIYRVLSSYSSKDAELVGSLLDARYRVDGLLGKGGMGIVLSAHHLFLDKPVAIKVLHPSVGLDDGMRERFLREARASSQVEHPNVVRITDFGVTESGLYYLVMEYLDGLDLLAWFRARGRVDVTSAAQIGVQLCGALGVVHDEGYVHRDLKPENVWVLPTDAAHAVPVVKLLDFGIAGVLQDDRDASDGEQSRLTKTGTTVGTVGYMSPEQVLGEPLDGRTDLYALGCLLYELATGALPFTGENQMATMMQHLSTKPPQPSDAVDTVPAWFDAVVARLLAKEPGERFASADAVKAALLLGLQRTPTKQNASPSVALTPPPTPVPPPVATGVTSIVAAAPRPHAWRVAALMMAPILAAAALLAVLFAEGDPPIAPAAAAADSALAAVAGAVVADQNGPSSMSAALREAGGATVAAATDPTTVAAGPTATLTFRVQPVGARVWRGKEHLGATPLSIEVPISTEGVRYRFTALGYETVSQVITTTEPSTVVASLRPKRTAAPPAPELQQPTAPGASPR